MKQLYFLLVTAIFIGCGNSLSHLQKTGRIPKLDRTDTLAGIDANNDGVRDDIEKWIKKRWKKDIKKQKAALQYARASQLRITVDLDDKQEILKVDKIGERASYCLWRTFTDDKENKDLDDEIKAYTSNTKKRFLQFMEYTEKISNLMNGEVISLIEEDTCEK